MRKIIAILLLTRMACFGQTTNVRITADGTVINTQTVKFATGKLMVNGVAVVGGASGVTSVTGTAPIVSSGGTTPAISITAATTGAPGSMSAADKTKLDGIAAGAQPGTVTSVAVSGANGVGVTGSPITTSGTFALSLGAITPTSVAASGAVSGSNLSGTNTGDQDLSALALKATTISTTSPLTGGGDLSTNRTFAINNAAADGTTKGAASFAAADFDATSGNIALDYTNGQAATTSLKGFLTSIDWNTFNGKLGPGVALLIDDNLSDLDNVATAQINLALRPGTDVQAFDADLTSLAGATGTNTFYYRSAANTWTAVTVGSGLDFTGGTLASTGGGGSVTNFSAGDLSPLFTTSEATTTTTPALTFSLSTAAANTFFGNGTGSTAAPTFMSVSTARTALGLSTSDIPTFKQLVLTDSVASGAGMTIQNTNASGWGGVELDNNNSTVTGSFALRNTTAATLGVLVPGDVYAYSTANLTLMADNAGVIRFSANGGGAGTGRMQLGSGLSIGNTTDPGASALSLGADPADAGAIRLENAALIAWEASPAGTDSTLTVNSSEQFVFSNVILNPAFTGTFTLGGVSVLPTGTELNFVDGVTSSIQTQLDAKGPAPSDTAYDEATWNGVTTIAPSKNAVRDKFVSVDSAVAAIPAGSLVLFDQIVDTSTTNTDGTEDNILILDPTVASATMLDGQKIVQSEMIIFVGSATAARRVKKFANNGFVSELIWDSGSLTLALGGSFFIQTVIYRASATTAKIVVSVTSTSASTIPYVTFTELTDFDWDNQTLALKTTGIASGTGAARGDITLKTVTIIKQPAGTLIIP